MNEYQIEQTSQTFHTVKITGLLASTLLLVPSCISEPVSSMPLLANNNNSALTKNYAFIEGGASPTYEPQKNAMTCYCSSSSNTDFEAVVTDFFADLSSNQESLGPEFEQVLFENIWDLYQS